jgi:hypothetical protein
MNTSLVAAASPRKLRHILIILLGMAIVFCLWLGRDRLQSLLYTELRDIGDLHGVTGNVQIQGVVTYVDEFGKRFWIQDKTGALQIPTLPAGVTGGQVLRVRALARQVYKPGSDAPTTELAEIRATVVGDQHPLPAPVSVPLKDALQKDFVGIRISVAGVVRSLSHDPTGLPLLTLGDSERELSVVLPPGAEFPPLNSMLEVSGIADSVRSGGDHVVGLRVLVQSKNDLKLLSPAPAYDPVYSLRSLFTDTKVREGRRVRVPGRVIGQGSPTSAAVEDRWGAITARFDSPVDLVRGRTVEISAFPHYYGPRLELEHATIRATKSGMITGVGYHGPTLTTVATVHDLKATQANAAIPVRIDGVVTFADKDWKLLFVQDQTGGIFLSYSSTENHFAPGDRVGITGLSNAGDYAPVIVAPRFLRLGRLPLPAPVKITPQDAASGVLDSVFVEVQGVIHSIASDQDPKHLSFTLYSSFGQIHVATPPDFGSLEELQKLEDAKVQIRGVCGTVFNSRRQLVGYQLSVSSIRNIEVLESPAPDPFAQAATPIDELLQFSSQARFNHRVKVAGTVTMVGPGFFYMQDNSGGLRVESRNNGVRAVDYIEAIGYAAPGAYSPVLALAKVRVLNDNSGAQVSPLRIDWDSSGAFDSRLVTIEGHVLSVVESAAKKTLVLESGGHVFDAHLYVIRDGAKPPTIEAGSVLLLTGISSSQLDPQSLYLLNTFHDPGFQLLIRSADDIRVLRRAPWWKLRHTLIVVVILAAIIVGGTAWLSILRRRVLRQNAELEQALAKDKAVRDLANAMQEVSLRKDFSARVPVTGTTKSPCLARSLTR